MRKIILFVLLILSILFYLSWTVKSDLDEQKSEQQWVTYYESWYVITNSWDLLSYEQKEIEILVPKKKVVKKNVVQKTTEQSFTWEQNQWVEYWKERIRAISFEVWYNYPELAINIAFCESGMHIYAKNKTSSARWLAQFLTQDYQRADGSWHISTWTSSSKRYLWYKWNVFNWEEHIKVFISKLKNEGTSARNASKKCWWK